MTTSSLNPEERMRTLNGIEQKLSSSFKPLRPNADFVKRVKKRLTTNPTLRVEQNDSIGVALGLLGIVALILSVILGKWIWKYLSRSEDPED